jgi:hypothetical protein
MTDRGLAFPQIGVIRKGSPKGDDRPGKDLQYFRVEFDDAEERAKQLFEETYNKSGGKPAAMRVTFPFNEIERVWDAWLEAYTASRLIARSDGEHIVYWKEGKEMLVKNGLAISDRTVNIWRKTEGKNTEPLVITMIKDQPVPYIEHMVFQRTEKTLVEAKPVGRLRVVLPELKRLAYLALTTTSMNDIIALGGPDSGELGAIRELCRGLNLPLAGVPLILRRKPKQIAFTKADGAQSRMTRWLVHVEADPEFVERALASSRQLAMPVVRLLTGSEGEDIVAGVDEPEDEEDIPATIEADDTNVNQETGEPSEPVQLEDPHGKWAVGYAAKEWNIDAKQAAQALWKKIPETGKMKRKEIMQIVTGMVG